MMDADAIGREAASIAEGIAALKSRPYQAEDKALVAKYVQTTGLVGNRSYEVDMAALDLPYPIWALIRKAYLDEAVQWARAQREGGNAD